MLIGTAPDRRGITGRSKESKKRPRHVYYQYNLHGFLPKARPLWQQSPPTRLCPGRQRNHVTLELPCCRWLPKQQRQLPKPRQLEC
mmetsp:Transcript_46737/g.130140  ORF Transcript_46737/g.130140 Transcript_46737/m.130140 type:complete len:86 (+) Transcript_46737:71-328(+)